MITKEEGLILLKVARETLELYLSSGKDPELISISDPSMSMTESAPG